MRVIIFILCVFISLANSKSEYINAGWNLIKIFSNTQTPSSFTNQDLLLQYKNNQWYGISPNSRFNQWLSDKNIAQLDSFDSGDAIWVYSKEDGKNIVQEEINNTQNSIQLKIGWNQVSISNISEQKLFHIKSYFENTGVRSIWNYDANTNKWSGYSFDSDEQPLINSDENISTFEYLDTTKGYFIYSTVDTNITFTNKTPFMVYNNSVLNTDLSLNLNEKDMKDFTINIIDPNDDDVTITLSGSDKDDFIVEENKIYFKTTNTKPNKSHFSFSINASDGTTNVSKNIDLSIIFRYENDYDGEYKDNVGYDNEGNVSKQWYLDSLGITSLHENGILANKTRPIIQIVEKGINTQHPDLIANIDFSYSYDFENSIDGNFTNINNNHGTAIAGIAAARGYNGHGIRGIAPFARLTGHAFAYDNVNGHEIINVTDTNSLRLAWAEGPRANDISISNNSWGQCQNFNLDGNSYMENGAKHLRDSKGRIYIFAAGNNRQDDSGCGNGITSTVQNNNLNNPYAIVVAAMNQNDTIMTTSTPGPNILVSAYGHNLNGEPYIWSTYGTDQYNDMGVSSTSAATAMVSGAVALLLDECPSLSYRDVKYILATTATKVDAQNSSWIENSAGYHYSTDYGFGKLNISQAIERCTHSYNALPALREYTQEFVLNKFIITTGEENTIDIPLDTSINIEWIGINFEGTLSDISDYKFTLQSPSGTIIELLHANNTSHLNLDTSITINNTNRIFRLSSVGFLDESSSGTWILKVKREYNTQNLSGQSIDKIKVNIHGY